MIETEDVVLLRRLVEHGRKHGALLNADNEAWGAIERLREENARGDELAIELVMAGNKWPQGTITADEAAYEVRTARAALNQQ